MSDEAIRLLRSIDASLKHLISVSGPTQSVSSLAVAPDRDLDGKYGNPLMNFLPRDWTGDTRYKKCKFSECPPELLEMYAETLEYLADKAEEENDKYNGKPTAPYKRKDAARARGWARRNRTRGGPSSPSSSAQKPATGDKAWNDETGSDADWLGDSFS